MRPSLTLLFLLQFLVLYPGSGGDHQKNDHVTIGIFTDCQYCDCDNSGLRYYRLSLGKLDGCVREFNALPLDGVFHIGDMIDHGFSSYDSIIPRFRKFKAPLHLVMGNHDYMIKNKEKPGLIQYLGVESATGYYTVDIKGWRFIVLNGDDLSYFAPQSKKQKSERNEMVGDLYSGLRWNGMPWNGGIGSIQMKWLEDQLAKAQTAGRNVVVLCHFPLFSKQDHILYNNVEVFDLINRFRCVKAYFNGHYHPGGYVEVNGIHMVNFQGMVNTNRNAFAVVTLTSDSILIKGYDREPDRRLGIRK